MRSVNASLFEINRAKSRVKAALANGQAPAQEDLDLVGKKSISRYLVPNKKSPALQFSAGDFSYNVSVRQYANISRKSIVPGCSPAKSLSVT